MRKFHFKSGAVFSAIILSVSGTAFAGPLAPGKPAGVHEAQMTDKEWLVLGGIGAVAAGIAIASAGGGHSAAPGQVVTVITTSATAP